MRSAKKAIIAALFLWLSLFALPQFIFASSAEYRQCPHNQSCEIGEFLFDDSYVPITTATCTFSSKTPSNTSFMNLAPMSVNGEGWYSIQATTSGQAYGLYPSQVCCTYNDEYLCLDKSFEIASGSAGLAANEISSAVWNAVRTDHNTAGTFGENLQNPSSISAADIWSYPTRSLTSFGTLVADIWSYSSRTLSGFGDMIAGIWNYNDRELTDIGLANGDSLATQDDINGINNNVNDLSSEINADIEADVATIKTNTTAINTKLSTVANDVSQSRIILEKMANEPIIQTFIEEGATPPENLQTKIRETQKVADLLSANASGLKAQIASLNANWDSTTYQLALSEIESTTRVLGASTEAGQENAAEPKDIMTAVQWLTTEWSHPVITNLSIQASSALTNTSSTSREIKSYGKTTISREYIKIANEHLGKLEGLIGTNADQSSTDTLYGYIRGIQETSEALALYGSQVDKLLQNWESYPPAERDQELAMLKQNILAANRIPDIEYILSLQPRNQWQSENLAFALRGMVDSNFYMLAQNANQITSNVWLEFGSIVFRSLITNPSHTISQEVPVKYYLPQEVREENIIQHDSWLTIDYDPERDLYFASGMVSLGPNETETFSIEVTDVWTIPVEEIASIRKQTETLFEPLKNTSYFAQGSTIKADIEVSLDKIELLKVNDLTPEYKIQSYREASIELDAAKAKLDDLKTLVSSAGSIGTVFGFVGGVQTIAVWGMMLILIAGFVFLAIYMKLIAQKPSPRMKEPVVKDKMPEVKQETVIKSAKSDKHIVHATHDRSTLSLIAEIIALKFGGPKHKTIKIVMGVLALLIVGTFVTLILTNMQRQKAQLLSPVPTDTISTLMIEGHPTRTIKTNEK